MMLDSRKYVQSCVLAPGVLSRLAVSQASNRRFLRRLSIIKQFCAVAVFKIVK